MHNQYRLQFSILSRTFQIALLIFLLRNRLQLYNFSYVALLPAILCYFLSIFFYQLELLGLTSVDKPFAEKLLFRFAAVFMLQILLVSHSAIGCKKRNKRYCSHTVTFFMNN